MATATLLLEKSAFEIINRKGSEKGKNSKNPQHQASELQPEYRKKIERSLRLWLDCTSAGCRRLSADEFFNNPLRESTSKP